MNNGVTNLTGRPRPGRLFVFSGPSGAGKSTVCHALLDELPDLRFSVSHTTRPPRPEEVEGRDYYFVTADEFERLVKARGFVEYATVHGRLYGTSREQLEAKLSEGDVLLDVDVQGARRIRPYYPSAAAVFVLPPSLEELKARLLARKQNELADIERRLAQAEIEIRAAAEFDYVIVNERLEETVAAAKCIITAERTRVARRLG